MLTANHVLYDNIYSDSSLIFSYEINYPQFEDKKAEIQTEPVNEYYKKKAFDYQYYSLWEIFPKAFEHYEYAKANGYPQTPYETLMTYKITYLSELFLSLYDEQYEFTGGAHGITNRSSSTWNLKTGKQVSLCSFFPDINNCVSDILMFIKQSIAGTIKSADKNSTYFENYDKFVNENFNEEHFYLVPKGIVIYFEQYEIAPYSNGIPEFLIPFHKTNYSPV